MCSACTNRALLVTHSEPLPALRPAALEHQTPVLGAHAHEKAVRPFAAPRVGLKRALALRHEIPSLYPTLSVLPVNHVPRESNRQCYRTLSKGVNEGRFCAKFFTFSAIHSSRSNSCVFGLPPKFSTPVEKTVGKPADPSFGAGSSPIFRHFPTRRRPKVTIFRPLGRGPFREVP